MTATVVWHGFPQRDGFALRAEVRQDLLRAGVQLVELEAKLPGQAGMVLFDRVTPAVSCALRDASCGGLARVLALALPGAVLDNGSVWELLQAGACDVLVWDHSPDPARDVAARFKRWAEVDEIVRSPLVSANLAGHSVAWISALRQVVEVAHFSDASVLITGESGTGKELVARLIHTLDPRPHKCDLVVSDCTTIVPELSGSEFFGHERGAFTGANVAREGAFALANGGTLFLDEIGELPPQLQAELLRVVQERVYKRVGSNAWQKTDFRLICATNRDLIEEQHGGRFRRDLYYRIASWSGRLPPLRDRREDIPVLTKHFIAQLRPDDPPELDAAVRDYLLLRDYPGNVRDLKQVVTRMVQRHVGPGRITVGDLPNGERPRGEAGRVALTDGGLEGAVRWAVTSGAGLKEIERLAGELAERIVIEEEQGNLQRAAARLGVTDRALQLRRAARKLGEAPAPDAAARSSRLPLANGKR